MNNEIEYLVYIEKLLNENDELEKKINSLDDRLTIYEKKQKNIFTLLIITGVVLVVIAIALIYLFVR